MHSSGESKLSFEESAAVYDEVSNYNLPMILQQFRKAETHAKHKVKKPPDTQ